MILTTDENDAVLQRFVDELNEDHAASSLFQVQTLDCFAVTYPRRRLCRVSSIGLTLS